MAQAMSSEDDFERVSGDPDDDFDMDNINFTSNTSKQPSEK